MLGEIGCAGTSPIWVKAERAPCRLAGVVRAPTPPPTAATRASWPLVVLLCGLPLWWVAGVLSLMPLLVSVPMAWQLLRMPTVHLPRGSGWWLLFLVWVILGVAVLWADAPDAVPGGGAGRLMVFGYRLWWYLACTVVLLWVGNLSRASLPDRWVLRLAGSVFVVSALGGLLGVLRPELEFRSLLELVLPRGLRGNGFVSSLIHPEAADNQSVLGRVEPRPKAPFPFTNSWGSAISLSLAFFVAALRETGRGTRVVAGVLFAIAAIPVLYSLNRGLWASLVVGALGYCTLLAVRRRPAALTGIAAAAAIVLVAGMLSPLGGLVQERMAHQHSNDRRGQLLGTTVHSVSTGSPVVGFGNTRDVQGSFASIAGAATPECPACGVPPLGTQGQLWLVLFSQGWPGLAFFLIFVLLALSRCWRCRTVNQTVCTFVLAFFLIQFPIYDSLGISLFLVMIAVGLVFREERLGAEPVERVHGTVADLAARVRAASPTLLALVVAGAALGAAVASVEPPRYSRTTWIELAPTPVAIDHDLARIGTGNPVVTRVRSITLDTESALLRSPPVLAEAARVTGRSPDELNRATTVLAVPNSRVLEVSVRATGARLAVRDSDALVDAYLEARAAWLAGRRTGLATAVETELRLLAGTGASGQQTKQYLTASVARMVSADTSPGSLLRASDARRAGSRRAEAMTTGVALGLLLGCARVNRRTRRIR